MREAFARLIGFGRASLIDDDGDMQLVQVTEGAAGNGFADRVIDRVRRVAEFGFASVPPLGSEVMMLRRGADRSQSVVVGTSHRPSRPRGMKPGDAGIYDVRGAKVILTENGLVIDCAGLPAIVQNCPTITLKATEKVVIDAPETDLTGDVTIGGAVSAVGEITARTGGTSTALGALRDAYALHKHGLVQTGTGASGPTDRQP